MTIKIDENSISISASGAVTGNICVEHEDGCFPSQIWNDFILVVLTWFNFALISLVLGDSESRFVDFMDGPYSVEMRKSSENEIDLLGLSGSDRRSMKFSSTVNARDLCIELLKSSDQVLEKLKDLNFLSEDSRQLEESARQLRRVLLRISP